jgi:hypothetical protein
VEGADGQRLSAITSKEQLDEVGAAAASMAADNGDACMQGHAATQFVVWEVYQRAAAVLCSFALERPPPSTHTHLTVFTAPCMPYPLQLISRLCRRGPRERQLHHTIRKKYQVICARLAAEVGGALGLHVCVPRGCAGWPTHSLTSIVPAFTVDPVPCSLSLPPAPRTAPPDKDGLPL